MAGVTARFLSKASSSPWRKDNSVICLHLYHWHLAIQRVKLIIGRKGEEVSSLPSLLKSAWQPLSLALGEAALSCPHFMGAIGCDRTFQSCGLGGVWGKNNLLLSASSTHI